MFHWISKIFAGAIVIVSSVFGLHQSGIVPTPSPSPFSFASDSLTDTPTSTPKVSVKNTTPKATGTLSPFPKSTVAPSQENFKEVAITIYAKASEGIKRFVESENSDLNDLKNRKDKLTSHLNIVKQSMNHPNDGDGAILNRMFGLLGDAYSAEIKYINDNTAYINSRIAYLNSYRSSYDSSVSSLLSDSNKFMAIAELINIMNHEKDVALEDIYKAETDINTAMVNHYKNVIRNEDEYASAITIIESALAKVSGSTSVSTSSYYQPAPQRDPYSYLTARQQMILNPITCHVLAGAPGQATVTCY